MTQRITTHKMRVTVMILPLWGELSVVSRVATPENAYSSYCDEPPELWGSGANFVVEVASISARSSKTGLQRDIEREDRSKNFLGGKRLQQQRCLLAAAWRREIVVQMRVKRTN